MWRAWPLGKAFLRRGLRYRYYGDLFWLRQKGLLTVLAVWSRWTAQRLSERAFDPLVLTGGRDPSLGRNLGLERDIPVLWIGKMGSDRRSRLLRRLRQELKQRNVEMLVVDGVEHPAVFEEKRTRLLNRTKIMVNLLRQEWDDNSLRYALAAHNGALVVSEPTLPHSAFRPGEHLVEAPVQRMADTILYYLEHEAERQAIVERAERLIEAHSQPGRGMAPLIEKALAGRPAVAEVEAII
jgi:hypothetical protein